MPPANSTVHVYELEPRKGDKRAPMIPGSKGKRPEHAEQSARGAAEGLLAENPTWTAVGIYHTYPNNGPVRRYVGEVKQLVPLHEEAAGA